MSKKKVATMTLKDFHGGSIPSELPLPSAPGMTVERKNDRPGSGGWGSSIHTVHRAGFSRQSSGNFARSFDERVSYLPNPANIGRNYDEDERRPVEGHGHRSQASSSFDDHIYEPRQSSFDKYSLDNRGSFRAERYTNEDFGLPSGVPPKTQVEDIPKRSQSTPVYGVSQDRVRDSPSFYQTQSGPQQTSQHVQETAPAWRNNSTVQPVTPGSVMGSGTGVQNVWTARRDGESTGDGRGQMATSRISQVSALEKVSSGRWNSRIINQSSMEHHLQGQPSEFSQPHVGRLDGAQPMFSANSSFNNDPRYPVDVNQAIFNDGTRAYNENARVDFSRHVYKDSAMGAEMGPARDPRYEMEVVPDARYVDTRGMNRSESGRYAEERQAYDEVVVKGPVVQRDGSRYQGTEDSVYGDAGYVRAPRDAMRYGGNEAVHYPDSKARQQNNSGRPRAEPSPRREYGEVPSDIARRGFANHDGSADHESVLNSYPSLNFEGSRSIHLENSYHAYNRAYEKEEIPSPYVKGGDHFPREVPDVPKAGRMNERNRASDYDQSQPGRLRSPGGIHPSVAHGNPVGSATFPTEIESKGSLEGRPKLKLLPRTKPVEVDSAPELGQPEKLVETYEPSQAFGVSPSEAPIGSLSSFSGAPSGVGSRSSANDETSRVERPKLSLKPRSQHVEVVPVTGSVKERMSVFGGARPRELVLKERGVDESLIVGPDVPPSPAQSGSTEKHEKVEDKRLDGGRYEQHDVGNGKNFARNESSRIERNESRGRKDRNDVEKRDDRRGPDSRHAQERREHDRPDIDKQESWRRPAGVPSSPIPVPQNDQVSGGGPGRVAIPSAAELAQAFSRSASFGSTPGYLNQRSSVPRSPALGLNSPERFRSSPRDVPFSRLTESLSPAPRDVYAQGGYRRTSAF